MLASAGHEALIVAAHMEAEWRGDDISSADQDRVILAVQRLRHLSEELLSRASLEDSAGEVGRGLGEKNRGK